MKTFLFDRLFVYGQSGDAIRNLQIVLATYHFLPTTAVTGYYGVQTSQAVLDYQFARAIAPGAELNDLRGKYLGPKTRKALMLESVPSTLIEALIWVESSDKKHPLGNDQAIGDVLLPDKAYGPLQIRKPYVDDVNKIYGPKYRAEDCLGNRTLSIDICQKYLDIYAKKKSDEFKARCHNGGPTGYQRPSTLAYWQKVRIFLNQ